MPGLIFSAANAALVAYGNVASDGSPTVDGVNTTAGQVTVVKTATGTYTLTLPTGYGQPRAQSMVYLTARSSAAVFVVCDDAVATVKTIHTFNAAGSAADAGFSFMIFENTEPKIAP